MYSFVQFLVLVSMQFIKDMTAPVVFSPDCDGFTPCATIYPLYIFWWASFLCVYNKLKHWQKVYMWKFQPKQKSLLVSISTASSILLHFQQNIHQQSRQTPKRIVRHWQIQSSYLYYVNEIYIYIRLFMSVIIMA